MRKWMVVHLHWKGHNVNGYWTGSSWSHNREMAVLYPGEVDAQNVINELPIADSHKLWLRAKPVFVDFREE